MRTRRRFGRAAGAVLATLSLKMALGGLAASTGRAVAAAPPDLAPLIDRDIAFAAQQLQRTIADLGAGTVYPNATQASNGRWLTVEPSDWTSGFFPGCLWLMYEATGDTRWRSSAERWTRPLEPQSLNNTGHDVGFKMMTSFGNGYRLTGNAAYTKPILQGAASLASRYNATVGATRSWSWGTWKFPVIIDNMMNLEILFRGATLTGGSAAWKQMAIRHSATTLADHVRSNGGTFHLVDFDPRTGAVIGKQTAQGYSNTSTWARGEAWGLYGFTVAYRYTRSLQFIVAASRLADYVVARLPADAIPYWDFDAPASPPPLKDTSAAAITAAGLLELSQLQGSPTGKVRYRDAAIAIIRSLSTSRYLGDPARTRGILIHAVGSIPHNSTVDVSLIYADYYFLEALLRLKAVIRTM